MRHIIPISGKDSLATALVQTAHYPNLNYEYFFADTGVELPETYEWLKKVEEVTNWQIKKIGKNLEEGIIDAGVLPAVKMRFCTGLSKIGPMEQWIGSDECIAYYGLRADENRIGYVPKQKSKIVPRYPLQDLGVGLGGVYAILEGKDLLPPAFFYSALYERVSEIMNRQPSIFGEWESFLSKHEKRLLFAGRTRSNCYFCFYQRRYEYIWLYDTHPSLFERMCQLEEQLGGENYTWREEFKMRDLPKRREEILNRKAKEVCKYIHHRIFKQSVALEADSEIAFTSCGLMCGK